MITEERLQDIERLFWAETNDPETEEWRDDLIPEEAELVADWDKRVATGMAQIATQILRREE